MSHSKCTTLYSHQQYEICSQPTLVFPCRNPFLKLFGKFTFPKSQEKSVDRENEKTIIILLWELKLNNLTQRCYWFKGIYRHLLKTRIGNTNKSNQTLKLTYPGTRTDAGGSAVVTICWVGLTCSHSQASACGQGPVCYCWVFLANTILVKRTCIYTLYKFYEWYSKKLQVLEAN